MAKLDYKVLGRDGDTLAAFHRCRDAIHYSRQINGRIKYGTWIVWNWQKENPLPGTSEHYLTIEISKRIRLKHIESLRRQGFDDAKISSLIGGPV